MSELPTCDCRGEQMPTGRWICRSPRLRAPAGVTDEHCRLCGVREACEVRPKFASTAPATFTIRQVPDPEEGPGAELHRLLDSMGLVPEKACKCKAMAGRMNAWGVGGCRKHREAILAQLRDAVKHVTWAEWLKAAALALTSGLAFKLNPADPAPGLLDEAIRRWETKAKDAA